MAMNWCTLQFSNTGCVTVSVLFSTHNTCHLKNNKKDNSKRTCVENISQSVLSLNMDMEYYYNIQPFVPEYD